MAWTISGPRVGYAQSQAYPSRPVTLVVPFSAGNASDTTARALAQQLSSTLGQQVVVDNRPGAGGVTAVKLLARSAADGHTLLFVGAGVAISQSLLKPAPYDMLKDSVQVSTVSSDELLVLVPSNSKFKTFQDFLREAKERGSAMTVGVNTLGSLQHLSAELLKSRAQLEYVIAPFGAASRLVNGLVAGDVDLALEYAAPMRSLISSGMVKPLAICSAKRSKLWPEVPTMKELGIPDYEITSWSMIVAPAQTPESIVHRLNQGIRSALAAPAFVTQMKANGTRILGSTALQASALMASEIKRWAGVINASKIELK
ncbi:Bug family tripartite tricarboxylate transporter substrate binding protein [Variovorax sp. PBL-E5]|uniref:Bug family tripartite tricarboxylate transporter substrate binding protein n=1 Tax=Variovorax sp. PBL-E5 TaxID=434014 RepID=UPI001E635573|nr:tripartite tricarboxylate transporter substrate binding protein [Variovorax sp. PBL-E5]